MAEPEKRRITPEIVKEIADLIGLDVDERRAAELAPQIQSLRDGIEAMAEVDLTDVEPATTFPLRRE